MPCLSWYRNTVQSYVAAGGPLSEKWSEIFPQEQTRRGVSLDDKSWTSYLRLLTQLCQP